MFKSLLSDISQDKTRLDGHKLISYLKENGINEEAFNRTRNKLVGEYIRQFNSVDKISHMFMANIFRNVDIFEYANIYMDVTVEDVKNVLDKYLDFTKEAISVVKPN